MKLILTTKASFQCSFRTFRQIFCFDCRLFCEAWLEICKNLFWCYNIWQNYKGQSCKVCWHVVSYWRDYGTPHRVLNYQWCGDCLLCCQDHPPNSKETSCKEVFQQRLKDSLSQPFLKKLNHTWIFNICCCNNVVNIVHDTSIFRWGLILWHLNDIVICTARIKATWRVAPKGCFSPQFS